MPNTQTETAAIITPTTTATIIAMQNQQAQRDEWQRSPLSLPPSPPQHPPASTPLALLSGTAYK